MIVGVPQSFKYLGFLRVCESFLTSLDIPYRYSGPTNQGIVEQGIECAVNEACLPVKMIHGQVASLIGKVDKVLVPRMVSLDGTVFCPKFLGMPDMLRAALKDKIEIVSPRIDIRKGAWRVAMSLGRSARELGAFGIGAACKACSLVRQIRSGEYDVAPRDRAVMQPRPGAPTIGVLGYPYVVEDEFASMGIIGKLRALGMRVVKQTDVSLEQMATVADEFPKRLFWHFSDRVTKAGFYFIRSRSVHGIIHLTAFGCGPDALTDKILEIEAKDSGMPYLTVTLDECTGEAGVVTRVEAFCDMLERIAPQERYGGDRPHAESDIPLHGTIRPSAHGTHGGSGERGSSS